MHLRLACALACGVVWIAPAPRPLQDSLDRRIEADALGRPRLFGAVGATEIGQLSAAAGVPMGLELLPESREAVMRRRFDVTGMTLREVLQQIVAIDNRYDWRDSDGVIIIRPVGAWGDPQHPLHASVPPVHLGETSGRWTLSVVAALLGAPNPLDVTFTDSKPFRLETDAGTVVDLLNAIVRSHGGLTWVFEHMNDRRQMFPYMMSLMAGSTGNGVGVRGSRPAGDVDLSRFRPPSSQAASVLDKVVGKSRIGYPLTVSGMSPDTLWSLSMSINVPMGIEVAPQPARAVVRASREIVATGRTLREVLDDAVALDPRYEWREFDGVVVVRTPQAWSDAQDILFSIVRDVHFDDAPTTDVAHGVAVALGNTNPEGNFVDTKRISLSLYRATALDLLNGLVRAHGALVWSFEPAERGEIEATGLTHRLTLYHSGGAGTGVLVR